MRGEHKRFEVPRERRGLRRYAELFTMQAAAFFPELQRASVATP